MDEKLELLLNAALEATPQERERSEVLKVGFDTRRNQWEVIVKYHGDLLFLEQYDIVVEPLLAGYAILQLSEDKMTLLSQIEEIEYVEKPKRLYFQTYAGKQASCVLPVTIRPPYLSGKGVLIGIADSGIDYTHPAFRNADGSTRILALWDQSLTPDVQRGFQPPEGFRTGVEFSKEQIDAALFRAMPESADMSAGIALPAGDVNGHGTAVAGIAAGGAGSGLPETLSGRADTGVAPGSSLLIVKLDTPDGDSFPHTTELMRAVTYLVKKSIALQMPIAVNLSFGNTYGSHDGTSLLERFLDSASELGRSVICVGSGNEGAARGHVSGNVYQNDLAELAVGNFERAFSVQLWKDYADTFEITLTSPAGSRIRFSTDDRGGERLRRIRLEGTELLLYVGEPTPYSAQQEIYLDFLPVERYVNGGVWSFFFRPVRVVSGNYAMYLPSQAVLGLDTVFYRPTPDVTLTIPSTASRVVTVGAYHTGNDAYADFSGRGYQLKTDAEQSRIVQSKPDLAAPGVNIMTTASGGGYVSVTGTSFATPFVTGAAALLMEWGIVMGNDPYLYGQKVKAYLQRGARPLPGFSSFPNALVGYGALCVAESIPD